MSRYPAFKGILLGQLLFFLLLPAISYGQSKSQKPNYKLLWKISGNGLNKPSYLFGTMHVQDNRAFEFSDSVLLKINECDAFALESHPDSLFYAAMKKMFESLNEESKFKKIFSTKEYNQLDSLLKQKTGLTLDNLKSPFMAEIILDKHYEKAYHKDRELFLDVYLYDIARKQGKTIFGLEEAASQFSMLDSGSSNAIKDRILEKINYMDSVNIDPLMLEMITTYQQGDIDQLRKMMLGKKTEQQNEFYDRLIVKRNLGMLTSIKENIHHRSSFIAVGAGHLPGEEGLIHLLRKEGYTVTRVQPSFTGLAKKFKVENRIKHDPWTEFNSSTAGYSMEMPGKPLDYFVKATGLKLKIYVDLGTPLFYFTGSFSVDGSLQGNTPDETLNNLAKRLKDRKIGAVDRTKKITKNGLPGIEITYEEKDNFFRAQFILRDQVIYMNQVGPTKQVAYSYDANRFLGSFKIKEFKNVAFNTLESKEGAFSVLMPGKPELRKIETRGENGEVYHIKIYVMENPATQEGFLVRYNDFPIGYTSTNDSIYSAELMRAVAAGMNGKEFTSKPVSIENTATWEYTYNIGPTSMAKGRIVFRGNRLYLLLASHTKDVSTENQNNFFNSFKYIDYEKSIYLTDSIGGEISMKIPHSFKYDTSSSSENFKAYHSLDNANGILYTVTITDLPEYVYYADKEELFKENNNFGASDSTLLDKELMKRGITGIERILKSNKTNALRRIQSYYTNRKVYTIIASIPPGMQTSPLLNDFFNSITLPAPSEKWSPYIPKADRLLADISSSDTLVNEKARQYISKYNFRKNDIPKLYEAIEKEYDDEESYLRTKSSLLTVLQNLNDSTTESFIEKFYKSQDDSSEYKSDALAVLASLKTSSATNRMVELVQNEKILGILEEYKIVTQFQDTLGLLRPVWIKLLKENRKFRSNYYLLNQTKEALDSGIFNSEEKQQLSLLLLKIAGAKLKHLKESQTIPHDYQDVNTLESFTLALTGVPFNKEVQLYMEEVAASEFEASALIAIPYLVKKGIIPESKSIYKLANNNLYTVDTYTQLKKANGEKYFPSSLRNQKKFAISSLVSYMEYEDGAPDKIEFLTIKKISNNGKKQKIYLYKYKYETDDAWYLAMSGPYTNEELLSDDGYFTYNTYDTYEGDKKLNEQIKSWLKETSATLID